MDLKDRSSAPSNQPFHATVEKLLDQVSEVVLGKRDVAKLCLIALLAGEHVLLEDVPGVGKTLMGKALSRSIDGGFRRIQFTPDLMPSDILGSSVYNSKTTEFVFNRGPIFCNFVLADEINRAPPRTQAALLEAMSDNQVSIDGQTHQLDNPFMVIATQNPFEFVGTYRLPESQLDRFLLRISMGYPSRDVEQQILESHRRGDPVDNLKPVCSIDKIRTIRNEVRNVTVDKSISQYMLDVVDATRQSKELSFGVSTRGALLWYRASQAAAFVDGRDYAIPDDPRNLAVSIIAHRVQLRGGAQGHQRQEVETVVRKIVSDVPLPS